jgi:MFS family permease
MAEDNPFVRASASACFLVTNEKSPASVPGKVQQGGNFCYHETNLLRIMSGKSCPGCGICATPAPFRFKKTIPLDDRGRLPQLRVMSHKALWQNRNFRLLFTASIGANLGDGVMAVALPWFATLLTRDPFLIGVVAMARTLPWLVFSLPMGVLIDRFDRRALILIADTLRLGLVVIAAGLAILAAPGAGAALALAALGFVLGSVEVLRDSTAQSILPLIVDPTQLERANGQMWAAEELTNRFIGPPLAGALIAVWVALPFWTFAAMMLMSLVFVARLQIRPSQPNPAPFMQALKEGLRYLLTRVELRRLAMVLGVFNFLYYVAATVLVLYAQDILGLGSIGFGALLAAQAVGGLLGSLIGPWFIQRLGPGRSLPFSMTGFVAVSLALAPGGSVWIIAALLVLDGFTGMMWNIVTVSYRQRSIPAAMFGRVNSAYRFFGSGAMPLGALAGGTLVAIAAPMGPFALHLPYVLTALMAVGMMVSCLRYLRID